MNRIRVNFSENDPLEGVRVKFGETFIVIPMDKFQNAVNYALAQAKASGEFDGDDYVLTDADIGEIAKQAAGMVDLSGISGEEIEAAVYKYLSENPVDVSGVIRYDSAQGLTEEQKAQARANIGALSLEDLPKYDGEFTVIPSANDEQVLQTAAKYVSSDIRVNKIPYAEVSNNSGGTTATIGNEV